MYCNGNCEHLDRKHKKCLLTGNKLCYMRVRGSISYDVYEHIGFYPIGTHRFFMGRDNRTDY